MIYNIVSDMNVSGTDEQIICIQPKSERREEDIYQYELIESCDTLEEAEKLRDHIQEIGVQAYIREIVDKINLEKNKVYTTFP